MNEVQKIVENRAAELTHHPDFFALERALKASEAREFDAMLIWSVVTSLALALREGGYEQPDVYRQKLAI